MIEGLWSNRNYSFEGKHYRIGASIGLARINEAASSVATILQEADAACYAAKEEGRNRVHVWRDHDETVRSLVGQYTSSRSMLDARPNPIVCRNGLEPKLPPLLTCL